ncbi:molybdate ABC transporter permease subunit [Dethiosulfatibacter aminovorans]|nr:ABC transporter permease subunit [Dethiosulfatibacter aminovorans]
MDGLLRKLGIAAFGMLVAIYVVPMGVYVSESIRYAGYIFTSQEVLAALGISLKSSIASIAAVVLIGLPGIYYVWSRNDKRIDFISDIFDIPMVIPPSVAGLILLITFGKMGIVGRYLDIAGIRIPFTIVAVCLAQIFVAGPIFFKSYRVGLESIDEELIISAETLGLDDLEIFLKIILPMCRTSILTGMLMSFSRMLAEFGATIMFAGNLKGVTQTLPLAIFSAMETDINVSMAIGLLLIGISVTVQVVHKRLLFRKVKNAG